MATESIAVGIKTSPPAAAMTTTTTRVQREKAEDLRQKMDNTF